MWLHKPMRYVDVVTSPSSTGVRARPAALDRSFLRRTAVRCARLITVVLYLEPTSIVATRGSAPAGLADLAPRRGRAGVVVEAAAAVGVSSHCTSRSNPSVVSRPRKNAWRTARDEPADVKPPDDSLRHSDSALPPRGSRCRKCRSDGGRSCRHPCTRQRLRARSGRPRTA
jgi:hypothetical protein